MTEQTVILVYADMRTETLKDYDADVLGGDMLTLTNVNDDAEAVREIPSGQWLRATAYDALGYPLYERRAKALGAEPMRGAKQNLETAQKALLDVAAILTATNPPMDETAIWHEIGRALGTAKMGVLNSGGSLKR